MKDLYHLSTFSGIGGLDLAAERAGFCTVGQCEWADYPTMILEKHWPTVPRWRDIRTLTGESFHERTGLRTVDVISGGFPCQPFSVAGKRKGAEDDRYLWPELLRVIQEIRPAWFVGENVAGIVNMELDNVLSDLENIGYAAQAFIVPACAVDAPHRRDRCAIVAYSDGDAGRSRRAEPAGQKRAPWTANGGGDVAHTTGKQDRRIQQSGLATDAGTGGNVAHADSERREKQHVTQKPIKAESACRPDHEDNGECWPVEPGVGRVANGIPRRVDRLRCLGNAVVPAQFYPFFKAIAEIEKQRRMKGAEI